VLAGWSEQSTEIGDPLCRGLVCKKENNSPVDCPIECRTTRSLGFNSGIELSHSKPSATSITAVAWIEARNLLRNSRFQRNPEAVLPLSWFGFV
jgi:hypothetical protein